MFTLNFDHSDVTPLVTAILKSRFPEATVSPEQLVQILQDADFQTGLALYVKYVVVGHCGGAENCEDEWDSYDHMRAALVRAGCGVDGDEAE